MQLIDVEVDSERIRPHFGIIWYNFQKAEQSVPLEDQLWIVEVKQLDATNDSSVTRGIFLEKSP